jgi:hypothetical protein
MPRQPVAGGDDGGVLCPGRLSMLNVSARTGCTSHIGPNSSRGSRILNGAYDHGALACYLSGAFRRSHAWSK